MDLPGVDGGPLVVMGQFGSLGSDTLKKIVDKEVHDICGHGGNTDVEVDLLQHLVDVEDVRIHVFFFALPAGLGH